MVALLLGCPNNAYTCFCNAAVMEFFCVTCSNNRGGTGLLTSVRTQPLLITFWKQLKTFFSLLYFWFSFSLLHSYHVNNISVTFLPRCMECRRGLAMRIPSVRPSVRQTHELWQNGRKICLDFYTMRKIIYPSFLRKRMFGGGDPFYLKFWVNRPALERNRQFSTDNRS